MGSFFKQVKREIGIDFGTSNIALFVKGEGIVINEPTVVAVNNKTNQIVAIGKEAEEMLGKTPLHIRAIKPIINGVISDFEVAEKMLRYFLEKTRKKGIFNKLFDYSQVIINVPINITDVERRAVEDVCKSAGVKNVFLVESPLALALGAYLPISSSEGTLVMDIGGGNCQIAVISLNGVVVGKSLKIAGNKLNEDIIYYIRDKFKLAIGEKTAEEIKIKIGSCLDLGTNQEVRIKGRDLTRGLPKEIKIEEKDIREAITPSILKIIDALKNVLESTPPELMGDIMEKGVFLGGGTSLLRGLDKLIAKSIEVPVNLIEEPTTALIRGISIILDNLDSYKDILISSTREQPFE
ncbi:MAG: rod shape-determining protein [Candidatus Paceibacterota bacterium]